MLLSTRYDAMRPPNVSRDASGHSCSGRNECNPFSQTDWTCYRAYTILRSEFGSGNLRASVETAEVALSAQPGVLGFRLFQDGQLGVSVLQQSEELLVVAASCFSIATHRFGTG